LDLILGIESSCDETAAAVVADGRQILSSVVASQIETHGKYGGVVPELASREHLRAIVPVVREAMEQASISYPALSAIAVTQGPGLIGSLLVGITHAKAIAMTHGLPLVAVNHIEGHVHAVLMDVQREIEFPALALIVSGGHTHLFEVLEGFRYRLLGKTRDDAAGEAYDKIAKLLGFSYPGGPILDKLAPYGVATRSRFTSPKMKGNELDFSFSGMKTAALRWVESREMQAEIAARKALWKSKGSLSIDEWLSVTPQETLDLVASFQAAVVDELLRRAGESAEAIGARCVIISGGVACNAGLRAAAASRLRVPVLLPTPVMSTDNAAMIAAAAYRKYQARDFADLALSAKSSLPLAAG
jgi:N6-L-threonylcarbamoyladenine synthase